VQTSISFLTIVCRHFY